MKFYKKHKAWLLLGISLIVSIIFEVVAFRWDPKNDFWINAGFLVIGVQVSIFAQLLSEKIKRPQQARDLARALYVELAERAARCCFDCEDPWKDYLNKENCAPGKLKKMDTFRLKKFTPIPPIIYPSTANQIAILEDDAPQSPQVLIQFYYRLAALERDIENTASETPPKEDVAPESIHLIAKRMHQTLAPGLKALEALESLVDKHENIDATAIVENDKTRKKLPPEGSLRKRISELIKTYNSSFPPSRE